MPRSGCELVCTVCGATVGSTANIEGMVSVTPFVGWSFTTETGWRCPRHAVES